MVRYYCDVCGKELEPRDFDRVKRKLGRVEIEVMTAFEGTRNAGNICQKCIIEVVNKGTAEKLNIRFR